MFQTFLSVALIQIAILLYALIYFSIWDSTRQILNRLKDLEESMMGGGYEWEEEEPPPPPPARPAPLLKFPDLSKKGNKPNDPDTAFGAPVPSAPPRPNPDKEGNPPKKGD